MDTPLISVIIPVYKVEEYLDACVESVVKQTYPSLEIILVDDGSPDGCPVICDRWAEKDSRIRVIHKRNGGLSSARNAGLNVATGEYIGFVDSDDCIDKEMYEILLGALMDSDKKISFCYPKILYDDGSVSLPTDVLPEGHFTTEQSLNWLFYGKIDQSVWSRLFHRSVFNDIRFPEGENNEDIPLAIPMFVSSMGAVSTGRALYYYRARSGSITHSYWKTDADIVLKHLYEMRQQMERYRLEKCKAAFSYFLGTYAFSTALHLDKFLGKINENARKNHKKYIDLMRQNAFIYLRSVYSCQKDKLLYLMVMTRTLRPVYKLLRKPLD